MSRSQIKIISLRLLIIIGLSACLAGCQIWKKAALIGGATTVAAGAASALSSGALVPAVAGGLTASVMSAGVDLMAPSKGENMTTASNCAPDNFWTLLADTGCWSGLNRIPRGMIMSITTLLKKIPCGGEISENSGNTGYASKTRSSD